MTTLHDIAVHLEAVTVATPAEPADPADPAAANGNGHSPDGARVPIALRELTPARIRAMDRPALERLAGEIRHFLVTSVSRTGGHLGSNLGAVELSIALHRVFDSPTDPIVWDTGHQAYVHKVLTGRAEGFARLRKAGGLSGYPNRSESEHDLVENSHASTALGYADGLARARDARGERHHVVAVVGDGALTGGLAYEGLNNIGVAQRRVVVVLNDNGRSYAPTVSPLTTAAAAAGTSASPAPGPEAPGPEAPAAFFEALGFSYIGPVDGHDLDALEAALGDAAAVPGPVVVHVHTVKGRDYAPAERDAEKRLHDVSPFDAATGLPRVPKGSVATYTDAFGAAIVREAAERPELVAITAAMAGPTGLIPFAERYGDRLVDVGIAEQHAVTFAAGLATAGIRPVCAIYSTFLQRAFDQVYHDVCLQNLHVVFAIDRAGVVGDDGPTHHGLYDLSYLRPLPNMVIMAPKDENELQHMLKTALAGINGPVAVRYPRGAGLGVALDQDLQVMPVGKAEILKKGEDAAILAVGAMVAPAMEAAGRLAEDGLRVAVANARFVKPLDEELILNLATGTGRLLCVEENSVLGGFGSAVLELLAAKGLLDKVQVRLLGFPNEMVEHGPPAWLRSNYGLNADGIVAAVRSLAARSGAAD